MRLVPTNGPLEIAAYVTNDDIGFVSPGQKAEVKIDSFPFSRFGTIGATVTSVAHDAIPADAADHALTDAARHDDADSHTLAPGAKPMSDLVFATRLKLDASVIGIGYQANPLAAGMTTSVEIKTGQRRINGYLFSPLIEAAANAMKER
jgi:hemolysin D